MIILDPFQYISFCATSASHEFLEAEPMPTRSGRRAAFPGEEI